MSWFGLGGSSSHRSSRHSSSRPSFIRSSSAHSRGSSHYSRSSSYYKRRSRDGYINRLLHKLKHLFRELLYYARRNPAKLFFFVIMPLISGGVLASVAKQFGIRLPDFLQGRHSMSTRSGGYYGSQGYGDDHGRGGDSGLGDSIGGLMKVAKAFM